VPVRKRRGKRQENSVRVRNVKKNDHEVRKWSVFLEGVASKNCRMEGSVGSGKGSAGARLFPQLQNAKDTTTEVVIQGGGREGPTRIS